MSLTPRPLRRVALHVGIVLGVALLAASCDPTSPLFPQVFVSVYATGLGSGRVSTADTLVRIDCSFPGFLACEDSFRDAGAGGSFTLTAAARPGAQFAGWTGCSTVNGNDCVLSFASAPRELRATAQFDLVPGGVGIRISSAGAGVGHVRMQGLPTDIGTPVDCDLPDVFCGANFVATGDGAILAQASAEGGNVFAGWTDCPAPSGNTCFLAYQANAANGFSVVARFDLAHPVSVTVLGAGAGGGHVSATGTTAFDCDFPSPTSCSTTFQANGGSLRLVATPASSSDVFGGWTSCPAPSGNVCTIALPAAGVPGTFEVTARFDFVLPVSVTVSGAGTGAGHVASTLTSTGLEVGISCDFPGASCSATFPGGGGGSFNLIATAATGSAFTGWTGCPAPSGNACTISFTPSGDSMFTISARFDVAGGTQDSLSLYNGTASTVNMVAERKPRPRQQRRAVRHAAGAGPGGGRHGRVGAGLHRR